MLQIRHFDDAQWDGTHGLRWTGIGLVAPYSDSEVNAWIMATGRPPLQVGETFEQWSTRCRGIVIGNRILETSVTVKEGEADGYQETS